MPSAKAREFQRVAQVLGFALTRTTGSHERWQRSDGRAATIPIHGGREIGPALFFKIVKQLGLTLDESSECAKDKLTLALGTLA